MENHRVVHALGVEGDHGLETFRDLGAGPGHSPASESSGWPGWGCGDPGSRHTGSGSRWPQWTPAT